eukprot:TRINITY_DN92379_c0_g1_i1.p1 TRINITY_DN92379_c0_g1~~TRINITY_DN92379_c0_g1_i1.p1  ORF type:complete len:1146 (-),score=274.50 TRINITY_DN92379_c0_g1_i1:31-3270(-)
MRLAFSGRKATRTSAAKATALSQRLPELSAELRLAKLTMDVLYSLQRVNGAKERLPMPADLAVECVRFAMHLLEARPCAGELPSAAESRSLVEPHAALRLLAHTLPDTSSLILQGSKSGGPAGSSLPEGEAAAAAGLLAGLLKESKNLQTCSLAVVCLERLAEQDPAAIRLSSSSVASAVTASASVLSATLTQQGNVHQKSALRDAQALLHALPPLIAELSGELEVSALTLLASLQPLSVVGAPYVVRARGNPVGSSIVAGPPGLTMPASDCSWSDTDALSSAVDADPGARNEARARGLLDDTSVGGTTALQVQCRVSALRNFAQLFKLWPKAYFGRWSLVLDFQSGEVCRSSGAGEPLPMLLSICQQDPSPKVRAAALGAVCALLGAPSVRSWPVPLERDGAAQSGSGTSLTGQLAKTLRQSHSLVFRLLHSSRQGDTLAAVRACGDLAGCTPYTKLRSGLLSELLHKLLSLMQGLSDVHTLPDGVPTAVFAAVTSMGAALKRDDCASEITACLFPVNSEAPADGLLRLLLHIFKLWTSQQPKAQVPPAPAKASSRRGSRANSEPVDAHEPLIVSECALLAGRLAHFRPSAMCSSTIELFQVLVSCLVEQQNPVLWLRGFRLITDLLESPNQAMPQFSHDWCAQLATAIHHLPSDTATSVRAAAATTLPGLLLATASAAKGHSDVPLAAVKGEVLAALKIGLSDVNASVRTAAVQAFGALATFWFRGCANVTPEEQSTVLELVSRLAGDAAADVRSAAVTAIASFALAILEDQVEASPAGSTGEPCSEPISAEQRDKAVQAVLDVCRDPSDKARSSALRALGCTIGLFTQATPFHVSAAHALKEAIGVKGPPKSQWNACRSAGQLLGSSTLQATPSSARAVLDILLKPICQEVSSAANLKVRIQAAQALQQMLGAENLWRQPDIDMALLALCDAVSFASGNAAEHSTSSRPRGAGYPPVPEAPPGLEQRSPGPSDAKSERQQAAYVEQLRTELLNLAGRCCARPEVEALEPAVRQALAAAAPDLVSWSSRPLRSPLSPTGAEEADVQVSVSSTDLAASLRRALGPDCTVDLECTHDAW